MRHLVATSAAGDDSSLFWVFFVLSPGLKKRFAPACYQDQATGTEAISPLGRIGSSSTIIKWL